MKTFFFSQKQQQQYIMPILIKNFLKRETEVECVQEKQFYFSFSKLY